MFKNLKISQKHNISFIQFLKIKKDLKRKGHSKFEIDAYFEAIELKITFEQMLLYYSTYQDKFNKTYFITLLNCSKYKISILEYDSYLQKYKEKYSMDEYKLFLKATKLLISEEYYDIYLKECNYKITLEEYNNIYKTKPDYLTYLEYHDYCTNYKSIYTTQEFKKFLIARSVNLSYDIYVKYLKTKEQYKNYPELEVFAKMYNGAMLGLNSKVSKTYNNLEEIACNNHNLTTSKLNDYLKCKNLNIKIQDFNIYLENNRFTNNINLLIYYINKYKYITYDEFLKKILTEIYELEGNEYNIWNKKIPFNDFIKYYLITKERGFIYSDLYTISHNDGLKLNEQSQRNLLIACKYKIPFSNFNREIYDSAMTIINNKVDTYHVNLGLKFDSLETLSKVLEYHVVNKIYFYGTNKSVKEINPKIKLFFFAKEIYIDDELIYPADEYFKGMEFNRLTKLYFLKNINDFSFSKMRNLWRLEDIYIYSMTSKFNVFGLDEFNWIKSLRFGIHPEFVFESPKVEKILETKLHDTFSKLAIYMELKPVVENRNDYHYIYFKDYNLLKALYIDSFFANGPVHLNIPKNVEIVYISHISSTGYKGEISIDFDRNSQCKFLYIDATAKKDVRVNCDSKSLVYTYTNLYSYKTTGVIETIKNGSKHERLSYRISYKYPLSIYYSEKKEPNIQLRLNGKKNTTLFTRPLNSDLKKDFKEMLENFSKFDELLEIDILSVSKRISNQVIFSNLNINRLNIYCDANLLSPSCFENIKVNELMFSKDSSSIIDYCNAIKFDKLFTERSTDIYIETGKLNKVNLKEITLNDNVINLEGQNVIKTNMYKQNSISKLIIPTNIKKIEDNAFLFTKNLETIVFEGTPTISDKAFFGLVNIKEIDFGNIKSIEAYYGNAPLLTLNRIKISKDIEYIGNKAFAYSQLEYINDGQKGEFILENENIKIANDAFINTPINTINICKVDINKVLEIVKFKNFNTIVIPSNIPGSTLETIFTLNNIENIECDYSYSENSNFKNDKIIIPNHIKSIELPYSIISVNVENENSTIKNIRITKNTSYIEPLVLKNVILDFDEESKKKAIAFKQIFNVKLSRGVGRISEKAKSITITSFDDIDLSDYTEIIVDADTSIIPPYYFSNLTKLKTITFKNPITKIGEYAFLGCSLLTDVNNINNLYELGKGAFANCISLTSFSLCNLVSELHDDTFMNCISLSELNDYSEVSNVGKDCFINCQSLEELVFSPKLKVMTSSLQNCLLLNKLYIFNDLEELYLNLSNCNKEIEIYLPKTIEKYYDGDSSISGFVINTYRQKNWDPVKGVVNYLKVAEITEKRNEIYLQYEYEISLQQFLKEKSTRIKNASEENKQERKKVKEKQGFENRFTTANPRASWSLNVQEAAVEDVAEFKEEKIKRYSESSLQQLPFDINNISKNINLENIIDNTNLVDIVTNIFNYNVLLKYKTNNINYYGFAVNLSNRQITNVIKIKPEKDLNECEVDFNLELQKDVNDYTAKFIIVKEENNSLELIFEHKFELNISFAIDSDFDF